MNIARAAIALLAASAGFAAPSAHSQSSQIDPDTGSVMSRVQITHDLSADSVVRLGTDAREDDAVFHDISLRLQAETITDEGTRWGLVLGGRAQKDTPRRGMGRQLGFCDVVLERCASGLVQGEARGLAGLFTGFHAEPGPEDPRYHDALEFGYLYVKTSLFEARLGRGPGAAGLEADAMPGAFRLTRADHGLVDPEGYGLVSTRHQLSGISEKILVQSRRILGLRISASYTPEADDCGVDVCREARMDATGPVLASLSHVVEFGVSFDHLFRPSRHRWSAAVGYSQGEPEGFLASAYEDPWVMTAQLIWSHNGWSAGLAHLSTNDGVSNGDYTAWSASMSREHGDWLSALEWGWAKSDLVDASGMTIQLGTSRLVGEKGLFGAGIRYSQQDISLNYVSESQSDLQGGVSLFVETGLRF